MTTPLLTTKLTLPPLRPDLVPRPRLIQRLDHGLAPGCRLTLLSAPAGCGKTTLLSQWVHTAGIRSTATPSALATHAPALPVGWLSLDGDDNDPVRFLAYLVAAMQKIDPGIGQEVQELLNAPQSPPIPLLVTMLINDLSVAAEPHSDPSNVPRSAPGWRAVLVLDDYHTITEPAVHEALGFLLERQPPQMHLVIATRQDPPLPLSRLRVRGQVIEIRESDLRFSPEEAALFLNEFLDLDLTMSEVAALEDRTEGWVAGLQLAALALQGLRSKRERDPEATARVIAGFSGRHHLVLDYLTDEILQRQSEPVQAFLVQTSMLERMCGPLCDAVCLDEGQVDVRQGIRSPWPGNGQAVLEMLHRANLFVVPLEDERRWYRYHRLFADLLRARLQEMQPERLRELHHRAAVWYDQEGCTSEAVHHALATGDFAFAANLIERAVLKVATWSHIGGAAFLGWLDALPDSIVLDRPWLRLFTSRALYATGRAEGAEQALQELERWLHDNPRAPGAARILEMLVADRASYAAVRGEVGRALSYARQALASSSEDVPTARMRGMAVLGLATLRAGDVSEASQAFSQAIAACRAARMDFAAVPFACNLLEIQMLQGKLEQAVQTYEQAVALGTVDGGRTAVTGFADLGLAKILYERNDLAAAERCALEGLKLLRGGGIPAGFGLGHADLARIRQAQGDGPGALAAVRLAVQFAKSSNIPRLSVLASAYRARIWLAQGQVDLAVRWAGEVRLIGQTEYLREFEDLTRVGVQLVDNRPGEAQALLETLLPPAEAAGRMGRVIEGLALKALARQALGDTDGALDALGRALQLAEPEGYVRVFVDAGEPMRGLLRQAVTRGIAPEYVRRLLEVFGDWRYGRGEQAHPAARTQPLPEPLTDREMEVLFLLAEGLSNAEIGQRLVISLSTVKSHTRNIYGKLAVRSRKQAVALARAAGILSPL